MQLSDEQSSALDAISTWLDNPSKLEFRLGGFAGTGKTTLIKALIEDKLSTCVSAFTGKAVNVLNRKGVSAQTLHSLLYDCTLLPGGGFEFERKYRLDSNPSLIIVDEASMISTELYEDLQSFGKKLLFVGDPGQLEPVGDNSNLMKEPDFVLQTIHRQAAESPIIKFATEVRLGQYNDRHCKTPELTIRGKASLSMRDAVGVSQVICARNKTKDDLNKKFRLVQGKPYDCIQAGDKLIILRNNKDFGVFNGMIIFVDEILQNRPLYWLCNCHDEIDRKYGKLPIWKEPYLKDDLGKDFYIPRMERTDETPKNFEPPQLVYSQFGYCITCHKAQGSEWDRVLVFDEYMPPKIWDMKRWRYTAITRAAKELVYCL